jgi:hypothetical protein
MCFSWPDPISFVADLVTLVGVPVLGFSTWSIYRQLKEARKLRGVGEDCLNFYDVDTKCVVNLIPIKSAAAIPRVGERVYLPGETDKVKNYGGGMYEVVGVDHYYREDHKDNRPCPATPLAIQIKVRKVASDSK